LFLQGEGAPFEKGAPSPCTPIPSKTFKQFIKKSRMNTAMGRAESTRGFRRPFLWIPPENSAQIM